jgi:hypothetical protein
MDRRVNSSFGGRMIYWNEPEGRRGRRSVVVGLDLQTLLRREGRRNDAA